LKESGVTSVGLFERRLCCPLAAVHADRGVGHALRIVEMAKAEIEGLRHLYLRRKGRTMELDRITSDSALYGKRCPMCKAKYKVGEPVLAHFVPGSLVWVAWHASCVQDLLDPKPKIIMATQAEIDAFVARETARLRDRAAP
jgi:hypothetical protein